MRQGFKHDCGFDPSYGYDLAQLLDVKAPLAPNDFADYWRARHARVIAHDPCPRTHFTGTHGRWRVFDFHFRGADKVELGGWMLLPRYYQKPSHIWVIGHGYGGRETPDWSWPLHDAALFFPCARGFGRSHVPSVPHEANQHVLYGIEDRDRYALGLCVDDLWLVVHAARQLFPELGWIGYAGISFGGGLGALAAPWEPLIQGVHLNVPSFGHWPLRLVLPTVGSGTAIQAYVHQRGHVPDTLDYYDAASAAHYAHAPLLAALARFDPAVAPPGQFAIFNAWAGSKALDLLSAGHFDYPQRLREELRLNQLLLHWFERRFENVRHHIP
ncbi:MAG: acetylxylan esterase [Halothiobacillaceae bacterium]|nr:acetylxylan esterase [Halothiobacillaceae bacterium]